MKFPKLPLMRLPNILRSSVGAGIYAAIAVIVALTVVASIVSFWSFTHVGRVISSLTDERYPVVELSRDLAQNIAEAVALAPRLAEASSEKDLTAITARLRNAEERSRGIVAKLRERGALPKDEFTPAIDKLRDEINSAELMVRQRIEAEGDKSKYLADLSKIGESFRQLLITEIDRSNFDLVIGFERALAADAESMKKTLAHLSEKDLSEYRAGMTLLSEGLQLYGLLREVLVLDRAEGLVPAADRYNVLVRRVKKSLADDEAIKPDARRKAVSEALLAFGTGEKDVFELRRNDFFTRKTLAEGIEKSGAIAASLYAEVDRVVTAARTAANEGAISAKERIASGTLWLIIIVAASVLAAGAIAWFYVRPSIVRRLETLSEATRAIADGNLETDVAVSGQDEIGAVASAVVVFRDAAIEKNRIEAVAAEERKQAAEERRRADEQRADADTQRAQAEQERRRADEERIANEDERRKNAEAQAVAALEQSAAIRSLADGLARLSEGDLTCELDSGFSQTYAQIRDDFNKAIAQLRETITAIVASNREIANASAEIAASTSDLSQRTEEQAAGLEETSASMEEIATTVKKNAENAQAANQSAGDTQAVAERGGAVVDQAVKAMARIEESSHKIADIIGVIDEIARQTNLLALNAAVEAARAGDAGRGFAVVASEVRSLAQRSAQAAKDIKNLITDSNGLVKEGVDLVNKTGGSLTEIVESIKKVAAIVSDIAVASREQATGIEQVNRALTSMDETTQQNSALVEENAATAKVLEAQAQAMSERMALFRLAEGEDAAESVRAA